MEQPTPAPAPQRINNKKSKKLSRNKTIGLIVAVAVLLLVALTAFTIWRSSTNATIDSSKYQAVFFTNGQVYFGKLTTLNGDYMKLTDIFYLEATNGDDGNPQETAEADSPDVQLIKLGNEVHGPEDAMIISKDQVLFFENLKPDGTVSKTISTYKNPN